MNLGLYALCAPGRPEHAGTMFLDPASSWHARWRRVDQCWALCESLGVRLAHAVLKYPWGQTRGPQSEAVPRFLDVLALRDAGAVVGIIDNRKSNLGLDRMVVFEERCARRGIKVFYYCGGAPSIEEQQDLSDSDWRDLAFVLNASNATYIIDAASHPPNIMQTTMFIWRLATVGVRMAWSRAGAEAFPVGSDAWPNEPGVLCVGEDAAYAATGNDPSLVCDCGLLVTGASPPEGVDPNLYIDQARDALRAGRMVSAAIDLMDRDDLVSMLGLLRGPGGAT